MKIIFFISGFLFLYSCSENRANANNSESKENSDTLIQENKKPAYGYLFDSSLADGFIYPVKWESKPGDRNFSFLKKILIDTAKIENGVGEFFLFNPAAREKVEIIMPADGIVTGIYSEPNGFKTINTFHVFIENGEKKGVSFQIRGLDSTISVFGKFIRKNTWLGIAGKMKKDGNAVIKVETLSSEKGIPFLMDAPAQFVKNYSSCIIPSQMDKLIFAQKGDYKMYYFERGKLKEEYVIALSQEPIGHKQKQGDNKLPEGMYRITEKSRGPFYGEIAPWLGVAWMQFSYPNQYDAINGYRNGTITLAEKSAIVSADKNKKPTNSYTDLGGRVGIHGWNGDWIPNGTQNLTWGCISMLNRDIDILYDKIEINTTIIIVP